MSTLSDLVTTTVAASRLIQLTNKGVKSSIINTTVLIAVTDQVEGLFLLEMGKTYRPLGVTVDEGKLHDVLGVQGTTILLEKYMGVNSEDLQNMYDNWIGQLRRARNMTFRAVEPESVGGVRANEDIDEVIQLEVSDQMGWQNQSDRLPGLARGGRFRRIRLIDSEG